MNHRPPLVGLSFQYCLFSTMGKQVGRKYYPYDLKGNTGIEETGGAGLFHGPESQDILCSFDQRFPFERLDDVILDAHFDDLHIKGSLKIVTHKAMAIRIVNPEH